MIDSVPVDCVGVRHVDTLWGEKLPSLCVSTKTAPVLCKHIQELAYISLPSPLSPPPLLHCYKTNKLDWRWVRGGTGWRFIQQYTGAAASVGVIKRNVWLAPIDMTKIHVHVSVTRSRGFPSGCGHYVRADGAESTQPSSPHLLSLHISSIWDLQSLPERILWWSVVIYFSRCSHIFTQPTSSTFISGPDFLYSLRLLLGTRWWRVIVFSCQREERKMSSAHLFTLYI